MAGGLIQLVAYGVEDLFLTQDPQITYFKIVYRRHTNFSREEIPQFFTHNPSFGEKVSVILSRSADLIRKLYLVTTLPKIPIFVDDDANIDEITKIAWVRRVGYALIKNIEIQIGEQLIDRQYGEWMHIWAELTNSRDRGSDILIGNIDAITSFTNGKGSFQLFIPLQFWFNRVTGLALPIINLQYSEVKINLEVQDLEKLYRISPTHYIELEDDIVDFQEGEFIQQVVDGVEASGVFVNYDFRTKRLYYIKLRRQAFRGSIDAVNKFSNPANLPYRITGLTSNFQAVPKVNGLERTHRFNLFRNLKLGNTYVLAEYIFLDEEERVKFAQRKHEYLIEQVQYSGEKQLNSVHNRIQLALDNPTKVMVWVAQLDYMVDTRVNDLFNYTGSYLRDNNDDTTGDNLIKEATIFLNGRERISFRSADYFGLIQPHQHFTYTPSTGVNMYSFGIAPEKHQPSGTLNMSKIDDIILQLSVDSQITFQNTAKLRVYTMTYNLVRIANGLGGVVFTD